MFDVAGYGYIDLGEFKRILNMVDENLTPREKHEILAKAGEIKHNKIRYPGSFVGSAIFEKNLGLMVN